MSDKNSYVYCRTKADSYGDKNGVDNTFTPLTCDLFGALYVAAVIPNSTTPLAIAAPGVTGLAYSSTARGYLTESVMAALNTDTNQLNSLSGFTLAKLNSGLATTAIGAVTESVIAGYHTVDGVFYTPGVFSGGDGNVATEHQLETAAINYGYNGATLDRLKTASATNLSAESGAGVMLATGPGNWSINHTPAANTQATITKAAGGGTIRHVCNSITVTLIGLAASAEATVLVNLRDGATGAGTILWSARLLVTGTTGSESGVTLSNLNIVGSANTAMTLEFAAAGGASTFETVAMTGYDAS